MDKKFGKKLRKLRQAAGLTQRALGEAVGVNPVSIAQYETGHCLPREDRAEKIMAFFDKAAAPLPEPSSEPIPKKRGRPRKVPLLLTHDPKANLKLTKKDLGFVKSRPLDLTSRKRRFYKKQVDPLVESIRAEVPGLARSAKAEAAMPSKTPARLGLVEKDWLDAQIESHVHSRGWMAIDGPVRLAVLTKRDLADLCRLMLQVGGVQVRGGGGG